MKANDWQRVQLWPVGRLVRLYGTGSGQQARKTRAVALVFGLSAEGYNQLIQKPKSNSRGAERMASKGKKMQMAFCVLAKYALALMPIKPAVLSA